MTDGRPQFGNANGRIIKVGATGKIGSLMSRELESAVLPTNESSKKLQETPVSDSKIGHRAPMLRTVGNKANSNNAKKNGYSYIAKVVDLKCNYPMGSGRLKKLGGFSKLSVSII
ncbi:hypothetical protein ZOSMA_38G01025 [Zostera marina]|uniref:Uncharacterized protein n=1 Tax=Zostera marina TaxID=29655 RepID=A0A0K9P4R3_ZOSMR|nr:hypothetical protein ZOSMA_38G01025 [Zostera marina]